jgi:hypothetical protein
MVHARLNERETNPNLHINFITALPNPDHESQEEARQLLRALAAQVRPIMKTHGFAVNSFEEVSYKLYHLASMMVMPCKKSSMNTTPCLQAGIGRQGRR